MGRPKDLELARHKEFMTQYGLIYVITHTASGKQYVGQTHYISSLDRWYGCNGRWRAHLSDAGVVKLEKGIQLPDDFKGGTCRYLNFALRKYGSNAFCLEELLSTPTEYLTFYEDKFIRDFNTLAPNGYNLTTGGRCGRLSAETRKLMSEVRIGVKHFHYGKPRDQVTKDRIRESLINIAVRYDHRGQRLPKYVAFKKWKDQTGYKIISHPKKRKGDRLSCVTTNPDPSDETLDVFKETCLALLADMNSR